MKNLIDSAPNEVDEYRAVGAHKAGDSSILNGSVPVSIH